MPYNCKIINLKNTSLNLGFGYGIKKYSCDKLKEKLALQKFSNRKRFNFILVLDSSFSMNGPRIKITTDAAKKFINDLRAEDRLALISFNDDAKLLSAFSSNKNHLIGALSKIEVKGGTNYMSALNLSLSLFDKENAEEYSKSKNVLIFLSDGLPQDSQSEILRQISIIKSRGIEVYTVWVGSKEDLTSLMKDMASYDSKTQTYGYFYPENLDKLYLSFKKLYLKYKQKYQLDIIKDWAYYHLKGQEIYFSFKLKTKDLSLPGKILEGKEIYDTGIPEGKLKFIDDNGNSFFANFSYYKGSFYAIKKLNPGHYSIYLILNKLNKNCSYYYEYYIQNIEVVTEQKYSKLNLATPYQIKECDKLRALVYDERFAGEIEPSGNKPNNMVFIIDVSQSISHDYLEQLKKVLKKILRTYLKHFNIAVITYSSDSNLLFNYDTPTSKLDNVLDSIMLEGSTNYKQVFSRLNEFYSAKDQIHNNYAIFITDAYNLQPNDFKPFLYDIKD